MKIEDLNETCPFGHRSTSYFSKLGLAPNLKDAQIANRLINGILMSFVKFLDRHSKIHSPVPIGIYEEWGRKNYPLSETAPQSLADVIPIRLARSAEIIVDEIRASNFKVMRTITQFHDEIFKEEGSHMRTARRVMALLKDNYVRIFFDDPFVEIFTLEDILGIQVRLCEIIQLFLEENPELRGGRIAFSEVALWDEEPNEMVPSTRLLKILVHNWGKYLLERSNSSLDVMLRHAVCRALEDEIYRQDFFCSDKPHAMQRIIWGLQFS